MCLLLHMRPKAEPLLRREVMDFASHNPDGFGAIWRDDDGTLRTFRGMLAPRKQWRYIQEHIRGKEALLHWRFATNQARGEENCHPFDLGHGLYFMHNGVFALDATPTHSDTRLYADKLAEALAGNPDLVKSPLWREAMQKSMGLSNRVAFWGGLLEEPLILGAPGEEHKGRWYSNTYAWDCPWDTVSLYSKWTDDEWDTWTKEYWAKADRAKRSWLRADNVVDLRPADTSRTIYLPYGGQDTESDYDVRLTRAKDALEHRMMWCSTSQAVYDACEEIALRYAGNESEQAVMAEELLDYAGDLDALGIDAMGDIE